MNERRQSNATKWISFRVTESEYKTIQAQFAQSCHNKLSEYARNTLLQKPVIIKYRNESADQLLQEIISIKKELHAFGNNFNQAVKKLHTLWHDADIKAWLARNDQVQNQFRSTVNQLLEKVNQIHEQWSSG